MAEHPHRGRHIALGILVVLVAVGGFGYWWIFVRDDSKPVNVKQVEKDFQAAGGVHATKGGAPPAGVYLYSTTGHESVSALGGQSHTYPATTAATITATPCGFDERWDVLSGRFDINQRCRGANGSWTVTSTATGDEFFNNAVVDTYTCTGFVDLPASPRAGASSRGHCVSGPNTTDYEVKVLGTGNRTVGGVTVDAVHLHITFTQGGGRRGGGTEDRWVQSGSDLVLASRQSEKDISPSPVGQVTYEQEFTITLRSLTPRG